ncbi:hypothetical protein PspLS_04090 [Pyricularia sp. CBS 133598]|nr:hypothetical protein PspLS_04090 [Pyricularia sp. CBS 133598]
MTSESFTLPSYHGEIGPFVHRMFKLLEAFWREEVVAEPFFDWFGIDSEFKDFICKMTALDPRRRVTAREALQHP